MSAAKPQPGDYMWPEAAPSAASITRQQEFDRERAAILSSAVGMARLKLKRGEAEGALSTLDTACDATDELHREFLRAEGYAEDLIVQFLGEPRG